MAYAPNVVWGLCVNGTTQKDFDNVVKLIFRQSDALAQVCDIIASQVVNDGQTQRADTSENVQMPDEIVSAISSNLSSGKLMMRIKSGLSLLAR